MLILFVPCNSSTKSFLNKMFSEQIVGLKKKSDMSFMFKIKYLWMVNSKFDFEALVSYLTRNGFNFVRKRMKTEGSCIWINVMRGLATSRLFLKTNKQASKPNLFKSTARAAAFPGNRLLREEIAGVEGRRASQIFWTAGKTERKTVGVKCRVSLREASFTHPQNVWSTYSL